MYAHLVLIAGHCKHLAQPWSDFARDTHASGSAVKIAKVAMFLGFVLAFNSPLFLVGAVSLCLASTYASFFMIVIPG